MDLYSSIALELFIKFDIYIYIHFFKDNKRYRDNSIIPADTLQSYIWFFFQVSAIFHSSNYKPINQRVSFSLIVQGFLLFLAKSKGMVIGVLNTYL